MILVLVEVERNINTVTDHNIKNKFIVKSICLIIFVFCTISLSAQVIINEEPEIRSIMNAYEQSNKSEEIVRGWRIQIMTTNDRSEMEAGLLKFERLYPHIDFKWEHNPPYYQVRIGAYEKKVDLEAFMIELKKEFPSSIPVQDDIKKTEILSF